MPQHTSVCAGFADILPLFFAGELPKELGKLVNLISLRLGGNKFQGELHVPAEMYCVFADIHLCVAGELPKELGKLVNLKSLDLRFNGFTGTIVCPVLHTQFGHAYNRDYVCLHSD